VNAQALCAAGHLSCSILCPLLKTPVLLLWYVCYFSSALMRFPNIGETSSSFISTVLLSMTWSVIKVLSKTCPKTEPQYQSFMKLQMDKISYTSFV